MKTKLQNILTGRVFLFLVSLVVLALFVISTGTQPAITPAGAQIEDVSNYTGLQVKATALATATPLVELWRGSTGQSLVIRDTGGTPEAWANSDGSLTVNSLNAPAFVATAVSGGSLTVSGAAALNGGITADTDAFSVADTSGNTQIKGTLGVTGATTLNGGLTMDDTAFAIADTSGNTQIGGTLGITGNTTLGGTLSLEGVTFSGPVKFGSITATDGLTITHGLGTTPTSVIVIPSWGGDGSTITQTIYVSNVNSSTFSVEFTSGGVSSVTAYWIAGR